jgi:hypothetical protein
VATRSRTPPQSDPNGLAVAPLPGLGDPVAVTAWTLVLTGPGFSGKAFDELRASYLGKGPEQLPVQSLTPGSQ